VGDDVSNSASVTRIRTIVTSDSWTRYTGNIVCDEQTYTNQNFYVKTIESPNDQFSYAIPWRFFADNLSLGGLADVYTDQTSGLCGLQVGHPPDLPEVNGTNTLSDSLGGWTASMTGGGTTIPPQTDYFQ